MRKQPENMTAYDLTLQALDRMHLFRRKTFEEARMLLHQAIVADAGYGQAHSLLALLLMHLKAQGWTDDQDASDAAAAEAARTAITLDRNDALALSIFGHLQSYLLKDFRAADECLDGAISVGPSCALAWGYSSITRGYLGDIAESVRRAEYAMRLSPVGPDAYWFEHFLAQAYYLAGRYEEAANWGRLSARRVERNTANLRCLIVSLVALGEVSEARHFTQHLLSITPGYTVTMFLDRTPLKGAVRDRFAERLGAAGIPI